MNVENKNPHVLVIQVYPPFLLIFPTYYLDKVMDTKVSFNISKVNQTLITNYNFYFLPYTAEIRLLKRDYNKNGTHPSAMWGS